MNKKKMLVVSVALGAILVVGQMAFAAGSNDNSNMGSMMDGDSMSQMMNNSNGMSGMMQMMENKNMGDMMNAMNSPEGQAMTNGCGNFMGSYGDNVDSQQK